jgi:hypothetical protein
MYMGERLVYYSHSQSARDFPSAFGSLIVDGMAQTHCVLPWEKNLHCSAFQIAQHLQGVLSHGQSCNIYRTFHNVKSGNNYSIRAL